VNIGFRLFWVPWGLVSRCTAKIIEVIMKNQSSPIIYLSLKFNSQACELFLLLLRYSMFCVGPVLHWQCNASEYRKSLKHDANGFHGPAVKLSFRCMEFPETQFWSIFNKWPIINVEVFCFEK
jgi:hypothetical protein